MGVGDFDETQIEAQVGTRKADIVAKNIDNILVVEVQFGKADWDHWGRLEAYARLKKATIAVLVAEEFEELLVVTCNLRNEDSNIDWYLIQARVNEHDEYSFIHISRPAIDVQTERKDVEYSEFWRPLREKGVFTGKPVPRRDEGWISKGIKGTVIILKVTKKSTQIMVEYKGDNRIEKRDAVYEILSNLEYEMKKQETSKYARILFPLINKGREDIDYWDEIREKLLTVGSNIYNKIAESDI